jgi:hypothetical protein
MTQDYKIVVQIATLEEKVDGIEEDIKALRTEDIKILRAEVQNLRETLIGFRGSWKVILAIAGLVSTFVLTISQILLGKLFGI